MTVKEIPQQGMSIEQLMNALQSSQSVSQGQGEKDDFLYDLAETNNQNDFDKDFIFVDNVLNGVASDLSSFDGIESSLDGSHQTFIEPTSAVEEIACLNNDLSGVMHSGEAPDEGMVVGNALEDLPPVRNADIEVAFRTNPFEDLILRQQGGIGDSVQSSEHKDAPQEIGIAELFPARPIEPEIPAEPLQLAEPTDWGSVTSGVASAIEQPQSAVPIDFSETDRVTTPMKEVELSPTNDEFEMSFDFFAFDELSSAVVSSDVPEISYGIVVDSIRAGMPVMLQQSIEPKAPYAVDNVKAVLGSQAAHQDLYQRLANDAFSIHLVDAVFYSVLVTVQRKAPTNHIDFENGVIKYFSLDRLASDVSESAESSIKAKLVLLALLIGGIFSAMPSKKPLPDVGLDVAYIESIGRNAAPSNVAPHNVSRASNVSYSDTELPVFVASLIHHGLVWSSEKWIPEKMEKIMSFSKQAIRKMGVAAPSGNHRQELEQMFMIALRAIKK